MRRFFAILRSLLFGSVDYNTQSTNNASSQVQRGGVYASRGEDGEFSISKVLECDDAAVHLRCYNEKFSAIPEAIDTTKLTYFIGHVPLAVEGFLMESPTLIAVEPVNEEELEGYRLYLKAMGGE